MNFENQLNEKVKLVEEKLEKFLPKEEGYAKTVIEAMNYSLMAGGKRLRPLMMWECYQMFDGEEAAIENFMAAIEMIHTYSLVHDDLPAMDNDEYRRGRKTTHIVYGETMGILAGDGLLNYAFETASKSFLFTNHAECVGRAMEILSRKAGIYGMLGGQCADIEAEGKVISKENLNYIHLNKTAAMLESSMMIGAVLAGASEKEVACMETVARNVGLAFQIQDDILDVTSTTEELGKPVGSDEKNHKVTYVTVVGLEAARKEVARLSEEAVEQLQTLRKDTSFLESLIGYLIHRKK